MSKPPKDKRADDGRPNEEMRDPGEELTRPLRRRRPTTAPPPAPAGIVPQAPPTAPAKKRRRKPTMAPPPAPSAIVPQAPPSAPASVPTSPADSVPTRRQRRPTVAPPPAPGAIASHAPPTSPAYSSRPPLFEYEEEDDDDISDTSAPVDLLSTLSEPAGELMRNVADCVFVDSSFDFSQRITDHLVTYWEARRDHLITDDDGELEKDYVSTLRIAKSIIAGSLSGSVENLVEEAKAISDELDATSVGYYARDLPPEELRVVQSFHDLAVALMFYKVSFHVEDSADRQVMLASSMGGLGSLQRALDWFEGLAVPEAISTYAGRLEFKLDSEIRHKSSR